MDDYIGTILALIMILILLTVLLVVALGAEVGSHTWLFVLNISGDQANTSFYCLRMNGYHETIISTNHCISACVTSTIDQK